MRKYFTKCNECIVKSCCSNICQDLRDFSRSTGAVNIDNDLKVSLRFFKNIQNVKFVIFGQKKIKHRKDKICLVKDVKKTQS
jgi:hypothetical protein